MANFDQDFPKAEPVPRGCGEREPGGVYAECGLSSKGRPLEEFLIDPPLPMPVGLDVVNKSQTWQRMLPSGAPALDGDELPIYDLLIWVGQEHYTYCCDYIEETRRFGASRRLNPNLDLTQLSRSSRMILAHPRALNTAWHIQYPPQTCLKKVVGHNIAAITTTDSEDEGAAGEIGEKLVFTSSLLPSIGNGNLSLLPVVLPVSPQTGPCLFKLWELIPREAAQTVIDVADGEVGEQRHAHTEESLPLCLRTVGSTIYQYHPTGESADGLVPGIFAALPITGIALIRYHDGSVNKRAREKMLAGQDARGTHALPYYESDR